VASTLQQWLKQDALYVKELPKIGRVRFTTKIMQYAQTLSPPDVDATIKQLLTKSKTLAKARLSSSRGSLVDDLNRAEQNDIRAGIVYGALGNNPGIFLDATTAHDDLLDFIVERRYRSIQRMLSFVNPNADRMMLAYPPAGPLTAHVNKQSASFWQGVTSAPGGTLAYPFVLTSDGKLSPRKAIETLFTKNKKREERTLVDCPAAAMVVHTDALLVAKDPDKLAKALVNEGSEYVAIDHAFGPIRQVGNSFMGGFSGWSTALSTAGSNVDVKMLAAPRSTPPFDIDIVDANARETISVTKVTRNTTLVEEQISIPSSPLVESTIRAAHLGQTYSVGAHLSRTGIPSFHTVSDSRDQSLFDHDFILADDLQIGDHIYVANHPLHRTRLGSTIWNGEHSFILDPWQTKLSDTVVTGHGVTRLTVAQVAWIMLEEINAFLRLTRKLVDLWLALPAGATPAKEGAADDALRDALGRILLQSGPMPFVGKFRAFNLAAIKYRKSGKDLIYPSSWVMDLEGDSGPKHIERKQALIFDYDPNRTKAAPAVTKPFTNLIAVLRHDSMIALLGPEKKHYAVSYIDDNAGLLVYMPLYYPIGPKKGQEVELGYADVQDSIIFNRTVDTSGKKESRVFVTRPKVAATAAYHARLKQIGAIL
jgi:hypothetical protein